MNLASIKNIAIKVVIALVVLVVLYSVFWFFKIGQFEKQINRFVSDNSSNVSIGGFEVSGFPFSQKVVISNLRFSLPTAALNQHQIIVSGLEISGGIFDSVFEVNVTGNVLVQDQKGGSYSLAFNAKPQIKISVADGFLVSLSYQDNGHKVVDGAQNVIYSSSSSNVTVDSAAGENGKIIFTINGNVREVENFGVLNIYKNAFEGKLVDAIKTGQVTISDNQAAAAQDVNAAAVDGAVLTPEGAVVAPVAEAVVAPNVAVDAAVNKGAVVNANKVAVPVPAPTPAVVSASKDAEVKAAPAKTGEISAQKAPLPIEAVKTESGVVAPSAQAIVEHKELTEAEKMANEAAATSALQAVEASAMPQGVKNDFALSAQYILSPGASNQQVPVNVAQMQENSAQYSKTLKINNFSITNSHYVVTINGDINLLSDDTMPSGGISLRIEKFSDVINFINLEINKISRKAFSDSVNEALPIDVNAQTAAPNQAQTSVQDFANDEVYHNFLNRISPNFADVARQLAAKNPVTKDEVAQFDIRREKNLEFLVNETPMREILGKF